MLKIIHMNVNGKAVELAIDDRESLLDTLRNHLGLTSVKKGCEVGECGQTKGIARACFDFCHNKIDCLRIDTHADNKPMQNAIDSYGFRYCGIIHVADGTPRNAYDLV